MSNVNQNGSHKVVLLHQNHTKVTAHQRLKSYCDVTSLFNVEISMKCNLLLITQTLVYPLQNITELYYCRLSNFVCLGPISSLPEIEY